MPTETKPRLLFVLITLPVGAFGELFAPDLFNLGVRLEGVVGSQMFFFALFLIGIYSAIPLTKQRTVMTPSTSPQTQEYTNDEGSGSEEARLQKAGVFSSRSTKVQLIIYVVILVAIFLIMLWSWIASYDLLQYFPDFTTDFALGLLTIGSFVTGMVLSTFTILLGVSKVHSLTARLSIIVLIITVIIWTYIELFAYDMIIGYLGPLDLSMYIDIARLSSYALLGNAIIMSAAFIVSQYTSRLSNSKPITV